MAAPGRRAHVDLGRLAFLPICCALVVSNAVVACRDLASLPRGSSATLAALAVAKALTAAFYWFVVRAYLRRGPATATDASLPAGAAAFAATALPLVVPLVRHQSEAPVTIGVGSALLLAGIAWSVWCVRTLGRSFSVLAQARTLVTAGPYGYVRHPLYLGEIVATLGLAVLRPSAVTFGLWAALCALQVVRTRYEEAVLAGAIDEYAAYRRSTARLVPHVF